MKNKETLYWLLGLGVFMAALFYCAGGTPEESFSNLWPRWLISCTVVIIVVIIFINRVIKSQQIKTKNLSVEEISQLKNDIYEALAEYSTAIDWYGNGFKIMATKEDKRVEVDWAIYVKEVYFDFYESGNNIFTDWIDFYEGETVSYVNGFVIYIVKRFLGLPSRVVMRWKRDKHGDLEVDDNGQWVNIFANYPLYKK